MKKKFLFVMLFFLFTFNVNAQYNRIVAKDGSGSFKTVQAAIDSAPINSITPWVIYIKNGKYYEKINIPSNKPNIQLIGESVANVLVYYDDYAGKSLASGGTLGTQNSATVTISGNDFVAVNVTFANTFNYDSAVAVGVSGSQAVAVTIIADRTAFKNCRFIGMQDTLYTKGAGTPRHYFSKCYIDGIVDFIFGSSIDVFDSCVIYPKARTGTGSSYITAANTTVGQAYGYVFRDCKIPANTGATLYYLGRPWNNATGGNTANNKVVFLNTTMSNSINPLGWSVWDAGTITSQITYAEYKSIKVDGNLADVSKRVAWSKQFTDTDTVGYNIPNIFTSWNPCSLRPDFCSYTAPEIAISNFRGVKSGTHANILWNISWALTGITYDLYKSTNKKASFTILSSTTASNDTAINFSETDLLPASGASYFYFIKASLPGSVTVYTDTIEISSIPTIITTTSSLTNFLQGSTAPSAAQSYMVSGSNLLNDIVITAPANYEVSIDNTTWNSSATVTQTAGTIANTLVYVRLNAPSAANYSGDIIHSTIGVFSMHTKNVSVSGVTQSTPLLTFNTLQQWNLTTNNTDSAAIRAPGLLATIPTLKRLNLSNGTQVVAVPAYSTLYGQAVAPSNPGDGMWTTASGGSGGNLNRTLYEQFTIKPDANYTVRIDSFVALVGYYGTTSNTKIAVVYSISNFVSDSANVTGGRDLSGLTLASSANGAFTTPVVVTASSSGGLTAQYAFALNAGNGVQLNAGETLTIRIYFSCGSSSAGRYAVVKNVQAKGLLPVNLPVRITNYELRVTNAGSQFPSIGGVRGSAVLNTWTTSSEINTSHFNIQKSIDGRRFETLGKVNAKGNGTYSFTDALPTNYLLLTTVYYRLQIFDKDGSKTYSEVKTVRLNQLTDTQMNIYPNPATANVKIDCKNAKQISIVDYLGRTIYNNAVNYQLSTIDLKQFCKGVYIVKVISNRGAVTTGKLIVE